MVRACVGLLLILAGPVLAQSDAYNLPIREHLLDNGLRLLVLERPGDHRVAAKIFTDFGALVEKPGLLGAAHFLEHLMFKGTPTLGTSDWQAERPLIERIRSTEHALIEELNRARNAMRERGVFHDYRHLESTPAVDSLRGEIARLDSAVARYRDNGAMAKWYQAYGGYGFIATTEQEYMKFDTNLPVERVALFFRIEADRMRNTVFREFDEERMILVEQRLGNLNQRPTQFYEQMNAVVGIVHPVFWPEGWYPTDFEQYTRAYQRGLYEEYFVPNNTTVVLVGGVRLEDMIPLAEHYFGWMERAPEPGRVAATEPVPAAERRVIFRSETVAPRVEARYLIPGVGHPDRPTFDVAAGVIAHQLGNALRDAGIHGQVNVNTRVVHASRFGVPASLNLEIILEEERDLAVVERILLGTVDRLKNAPVAAEHLTLAKKKLRAEWYRTFLDADRLAFEIGHFQVMDTWRTLPLYLAAQERTTSDDLMTLARRYFTPANRTVGIVRKSEMDGRATGVGVSR